MLGVVESTELADKGSNDNSFSWVPGQCSWLAGAELERGAQTWLAAQELAELCAVF